MVDGTKREFRLVPGMAVNGFMITPLIESASEFSKLYSSDHSLDGKKVRSFKVIQHNGITLDWDNEYIMAFGNLTH